MAKRLTAADFFRMDALSAAVPMKVHMRAGLLAEAFAWQRRRRAGFRETGPASQTRDGVLKTVRETIVNRTGVVLDYARVSTADQDAASGRLGPDL